MSTQTLTKIPGPSPLPLLGNLLDLNLDDPIGSLMAVGRKYGPVFALELGGSRETLVCSRKILEELCDESRFHKVVVSGVEKLRPLAGDGLFTAQHNNLDWEVAHRVLMPLFGPLRIQDMFEGMRDISEQLCLKWARLGPSATIDISNDFTRLTLDTIALCTMDFRFNSFYSNEKMHPFIESMAAALVEADTQSMLPDIITACRVRSLSKFKKHITSMKAICHELVQERRRHPGQNKDLLDAMMNGSDPKTGRKMSDESIIDNLITFLVAGHETTSGLLSFLFYYILENPETLQKAREEVDSVVGDETLSVQHLAKMPYIDMIMRETLRLMPTAPGFYVAPFKDDVIGGQYPVSAGHPLLVFLHLVHRDPEVWGDDAEDFRPERMADDKFDKLPKKAWIPFGNGMRGCIGRAFAWQEAQLTIAMILANFDVSKADPNYTLKIKQSLTIKPMGFNIQVKLREGKLATSMFKTRDPAHNLQDTKTAPGASIGLPGSGKPISIFFGSNTGTCEALAHRLSSDCAAFGFASPAPLPLNSAAGNLPRDGPVIILAATYDGQPSDNAVDFVRWTESLKPGELDGVQYAVFGCGHKDWTSTLFKVPKRLDMRLAEAGAEKLVDLGVADASTGQLYSEFESWTRQSLWPRLANHDDKITPYPETASDIELEVTAEQRQRINPRSDFARAQVVDNQVLSRPGVPKKQSLFLKLPEGMQYKAGDHLQVLPMNHPKLVKQALSLFGMDRDTMLTISSKWPTYLPTNTPLAATDLFNSLVELSQTLTQRNLGTLAAYTPDDDTKNRLHSLAGTSYSDVLEKRMSILDVLEQHRSIKLPLPKFLTMIPQMRPRTYSLASAPDWKPGHGLLLFSVVGPDETQRHNRHNYGGLATTYMANLEPGDSVFVSLRPCRPDLTASVSLLGPLRPVIMVAVGAGLAPFHGLLQQRFLEQGQKGEVESPCLLFFGCRGAQLDDICRDNLDQYERSGVVSVHRAYSRDAGAECKYVQNLVTKHHETISDYWKRGAVVMICSGKKVADQVLDIMRPIILGEVEGQVPKDKLLNNDEWKNTLLNDRLILEVFS